MEKTLFANLRSIIYRYRSRFFRAFAMVLFSNCLIVLNPLIMRQAVLAMDASTASVPQNLIGRILYGILGSYSQKLLPWVVILLSVAATASLFKYLMRTLFMTISRDAEKEMRLKIFERIQQQSRAFYDHHGIGELLSRLTNDISAYRDVLGPGVMYPIFFSTLMIPGLIALYNISPQLTAFTLIPLFLIPIINIFIRKEIYQLSSQVQESLANLSNMTQEHFSAIRIIKSYVIERPTFELFRELCKRMIGMSLKLSLYQGILIPVFTLLTKVVTIGLVLLLGWIVLKGWSTLNAADFISFMWIQSYVFFPVLWLAWILPIYARGKASYDRLYEVYREPIEVKDTGTKGLEIPPKADISFNHLNFTYPYSDRQILKDLNSVIKGGSFVGITGPIGSGKTTLIRLLNREYEVPRGMITIGGRDIHDYPLQAFSESMVTVEQIPFLFSKTIAENVLFGRDDASQSELELVSRHADLHDTVMEFPQQYDTLIGERGVTLSGGQKQRIVMARAFLVNRSILLLDDIFSAVDTGTERRIFEGMKKNFEGRTIILITHRISILEQLDRVIYMKDGQIVEDGSPEELLKKKGYYACLHDLQSLERRSLDG